MLGELRLYRGQFSQIGIEPYGVGVVAIAKGRHLGNDGLDRF